MKPDETSGSRQAFWDRVHQDDCEDLREAVRLARERHEAFSEDFRVVWRDGTTHWLHAQGRYQYAANGEPQRMLGIAVDITQSKQAEQALRESEQRLRLAMETGRMYAFEWDVASGVVVRSPEHVEVLGITKPLPSSYQEFMEKIDPEDRSKFTVMIAGLTPENPTARITFRLEVSDDAFVWLSGSGRAFFDGEGRMLRVIGMTTDVTDSKRTEDALAGMTRKLIESQEQERARIGRELHDDINQRLAMLTVELDEMRQNPSELQGRVEELRKRISTIWADVQDLSHDLHPSKIEYLGVGAGIKSWCKEFAKRHRIQIDCKDGVRSTLAPEIGLCLFRIVQEAMHNSVKHSGVKRIEVELREDSHEIHLLVSDLGAGFDVETAKQGEGLGLTSMRERVRLVNGTIAINSRPMGGTTIDVRIPIKPDQESHRATG